jgi:Methyltransferase domain
LFSVHRYHEISESTHSTLNPLSVEKLALVEDICRFASRSGATGVGVDIHPRRIEHAKERARTLGVKHAVEFQLGNGAAFDPTGRTFDIVSSIGTFDMLRAVNADDAQAQNV